MSTRKIEAEVLQLPVQQRAKLARTLIESLDSEREADPEAAWVAEAKRRFEDLRSGRVKGRTSAQVFARVRAGLSARK